MLRRIWIYLVLLPVAAALVMLMVANRQPVTLSFDPFDNANPAFAITVPLFGLILGALALGVIAGGFAASMRQWKWRRVARRQDGELQAMRRTLEQASARPDNARGTIPAVYRSPAA